MIEFVDVNLHVLANTVPNSERIKNRLASVLHNLREFDSNFTRWSSGKMSTPASVYERIGGAEAINSFVVLFYERVIADPLLAPFFQNTDMERQMTAQSQFMTMVLGGPVLKSDFDLAEVHRGRGIRREHLTRFTEHLLAALHRADVSRNDADEIVSRVATWSEQVLGESGGVDG